MYEEIFLVVFWTPYFDWTKKNNFIDNHSKTNYEPVRIGYSSYEVEREKSDAYELWSQVRLDRSSINKCSDYVCHLANWYLFCNFTFTQSNSISITVFNTEESFRSCKIWIFVRKNNWLQVKLHYCSFSLWLTKSSCVEHNSRDRRRLPWKTSSPKLTEDIVSLINVS